MAHALLEGVKQGWNTTGGIQPDHVGPFFSSGELGEKVGPQATNHTLNIYFQYSAVYAKASADCSRKPKSVLHLTSLKSDPSVYHVCTT